MLQAIQGKHVDRNTLFTVFVRHCISRKGRKGNYAKPAKSHILAAAFPLCIFCVNRISVVKPYTGEFLNFS